MKVNVCVKFVNISTPKLGLPIILECFEAKAKTKKKIFGLKPAVKKVLLHRKTIGFRAT